GATPAAPGEGSVGAGTGATVGKLHRIERAMRGGIGSASTRAEGAVVGALVAVNAVGDVRDPDTGALLAGARDAHDGRRLIDTARALRSARHRKGTRPNSSHVAASYAARRSYKKKTYTGCCRPRA